VNNLENWIWLELEDVCFIHQQQIKTFGGLDGIRDIHIVESSVNRSKNRLLYTQPDVSDLASSYAFALARYHGFIDGNKRTVWMSLRMFLLYNRYTLFFNEKDVEARIVQLAEGDFPEENFAQWIRE